MADPIRRGSALPIASRQIVRHSPTNGYSVWQEFSGLDTSEVESLMYDYIRAGVETELQYDNGVARLLVNDGTQDFIIDVWQIVGTAESVDGLSHPSLSFLYVFGNNVLLRLLRLYIDDPTDTNLDNLINSDEWNTLSSDQQDLVTREWERQLAGQTSYKKAKYVLRHTTNAPNGWSANIADFGIEQIYTPAQLLSEAEDGDLWTFPLPGRLSFKISHIEPEGPINNYLWGWLKSPSHETTTANNRIEITQEYELDLWSTDKYDPYS